MEQNTRTALASPLLEETPAPTASQASADDPEIGHMARQLVRGSLQAIHDFGHDLGGEVSEHTDALLAEVKGCDLDIMGRKLGQIVSTAQTLNLHALSDSRSRLPLLGPYLDKLRLRKNDFVRQFQDVRTQIEALMNEVDAMQKGLGERNASLEASFVSVTEEHQQIGYHIKAGEMAIALIQEEISLQNKNADPLHGQLIQTRIAALSALEKRTSDLRMLQHAALQQLPMIRMVQTNNQMLIEKFHTIKMLTVPAWKRQFMLAVSLNEQRNAVLLATTIDDATNAFLKENARLLKENTISTAQANQRLVIDIETLQSVHDSLLSTVQEVIRINQEGAQQRAGLSAQLAGMRDALTTRIGQQ